MHAHVSTQILSGSIGNPEAIQLGEKSPMLARAALPSVIAPLVAKGRLIRRAAIPTPLLAPTPSGRSNSSN
jgi:hypothetical protein